MEPYRYPSNPCIYEQEIKKSRFITHLTQSCSRQEALDYIKLIKSKYPGARHHCYAYIIGHPKTTTELSISDDGEPSGTAGRPMLNVLLHQNIGDTVAIVVRYFGGTKLGKGGLTRAYSRSIIGALGVAELTVKIALKNIKLSLPFAFENILRQQLEQVSGTIVKIQYDALISAVVSVPINNIKQLTLALITMSNAEIKIEE